MTLPVRITSDATAVTTRQLSKRYGAQTALENVGLCIPRGSVYLLVGPNGAGKSSILKLLLGLTRATTGTIEVFGFSPTQHEAIVRANTGHVPERNEWSYGWMTVREALLHHAGYYPSWDVTYARHLADTFELRLNQRVGTLSKGQARRAFLVMALAHRPPLLLLDEPTDGLDPLMRDQTLATLSAHLADSDTTVLLSTHHVAEVEPLADYLGVLVQGTLKLQVSTAELSSQLRRYRARVPNVWHDAIEIPGTVLRRSPPAREIEWIVWGQPEAVTAELERAGASVLDCRPLSLSDATLACIST